MKYLFYVFSVLFVISCAKEEITVLEPGQSSYFEIDEQSGDTLFLLFIPNSFTPNGDGVNDYFYVKGSYPVLQYELNIHDQHGNRAFYCNVSDSLQNPLCYWDGQHTNATSGHISMEGMYTFKILLTALNEKVYQVSGEITMVR